MRVIIAGIVGGVVLFMWGYLWWTNLYMVLLPEYRMTDEAAVKSVMVDNLPETGMYWIPGLPEEDAGDAEMEAVEQAHLDGPIAMIYYNRDGRGPIGGMLARGVAINIIACLIAASLLMLAAGGRGYGARVVFVLGLGLFICAAVHLVNWNFMNMPTDILVFRIGDALFGWLIVGLVIAAIVKRPSGAVSANEW